MNRSLTISVSLAAFALIWILSGTLSEDPDKQSKNESSSSMSMNNSESLDAPAFKVKVEDIEAETIVNRIELQGGIESARQIEIRAETDGAINAIRAKKGDRVAQGQQILSLALNDRTARLNRAKAELKVRQADLKSGLSLKAKNLLSENQHQQNLANVAAAKAEVNEIEVELQHTSVRAAFDGVLDTIHVELGDYVSAGSPLATLIDDQYITITAQVPQQHISQLTLGQKVSATLLDGTLLEGRIHYIASSAHASTRTFRIEAKSENTAKVQRFGQSARVSILLGEQRAHKLSPSLLNLSSEGLLQIKGIDDDNKVVTNQVKIIRSENDGIWLDGLPDQFRVITVGQGFVSQGDLVTTVANKKEPVQGENL